MPEKLLHVLFVHDRSSKKNFPPKLSQETVGDFLLGETFREARYGPFDVASYLLHALVPHIFWHQDLSSFGQPFFSVSSCEATLRRRNTSENTSAEFVVTNF